MNSLSEDGGNKLSARRTLLFDPWICDSQLISFMQFFIKKSYVTVLGSN